MDELKNIVLDTSALIQNPEILDKSINIYHIIMPIGIIYELDGIKDNINCEKASSARKVISKLKQYKNEIQFVENKTYEYAEDNGKISNDDYIIFCAKNYNAYLMTLDLAMELKAKFYDITCIDLVLPKKEVYSGYKYVKLDDEKMAELYSNLKYNYFNCLINEYIIIQNSQGEVVDKMRWDGEKFIPIRYKVITNYLEKVKPRNAEQELLVDLLFNDNIPIKVVTGNYGSGKTLFSSMAALSMIDGGKYDSMIYLRNNYGVKNTKDIGALPAGKCDKLLPFASPLADHVGGECGLQMLIGEHRLEIEHLGFLRGRNLANKIIMVNESENLTKEHVQLIISRMAEGSILIFDGDTKQIDNKIFEKNNGLTSVIDSLKGNPLFGCVRLSKTERSDAAKLAEYLD